ncbi:MAG: hypothetical protein EXX96DRAFT_605694 [Benjaminiella poitrasii]|nr:MAG: hypothetical protein EXX96DRAFT_605694 [Benjaminiella poitrasii]
MTKTEVEPISEGNNLLKRHAPKSHVECENDVQPLDIATDKMYECTICKEQFSNSKQLYNHLNFPKKTSFYLFSTTLGIKTSHYLTTNMTMSSIAIARQCITNQVSLCTALKKKMLSKVDKTILYCNIGYKDAVAIRCDSLGNFACPMVNCLDAKFSSINTLFRHMKKMHDLNGEIGLFENDDNGVRKRTKLQSPEFDLRRGSHLALSNSSELSSYHQTLALSCSSLALHFKHHSMKSTHTSYGLIRNDLMLDMLAKISFENQNYSQPLECIVQIHKDKGNCVERDTSGSSILNI